MPVATANQAANLLSSRFLAGREEKLVVLHLDADQRTIGIEEYPGSTDETQLPLREIFASALQRDSVGLIVAHNHPSGDPTPSRADLQATRRLDEVASALGIQLHDHLIFAGGECRSFRALGLL